MSEYTLTLMNENTGYPFKERLDSLEAVKRRVIWYRNRSVGNAGWSILSLKEVR